ncbi:hypothetical protein GCM10027430_36140 [Lysobacter tyrosinilyticus]
MTMTEPNPYSPPLSPTADAPALRPTPQRSAKPNIFRRCWQGSARLWQAYWLIGIAGQIMLLAGAAVLAIAWSSVLSATSLASIAQLVLLPLYLGYMAFSWICIWRCAHNVDNPAWGGLARALVGFSALATAIKAFNVVQASGLVG